MLQRLSQLQTSESPSSSRLIRAALVLAAGLALAACSGDAAPEPSGSPTAVTPETSAPATEPAPVPSDEPAETAASEPAAGETPAPTGGSDEGRGSVTVHVLDTTVDTGAGRLFASAEAEVFESEAGSCTYTFVTEKGATIERGAASEANVSTMVCGEVSVPLSRLDSGTVSLTVDYVSGASRGSSETVTVEVP